MHEFDTFIRKKEFSHMKVYHMSIGQKAKAKWLVVQALFQKFINFLDLF